ncbi:MAG: cation:proton antiporter [Chlamydia sp.]
MDSSLKIVSILTIGCALASTFGYICRRTNFPAILGYLLAGYIIGPYFPGFVADMHLAEQLAEIGVILMLFGVGMHFKIEDLIKVKRFAIPGALGQMTASALIAIAFTHFIIGWSIEASIIMGLAIGVASTVVLVRVLTDNSIIKSTEGHVAIGWTIVEDLITVMALLLIPMLTPSFQSTSSPVWEASWALLSLLGKFAFLTYFMLTIGQKIVSYILAAVVRLRSHELFTLTVLALIFAIAVGSSFIFGTSIALGAFIAGVVIGQSDTSHQASANALPLKEVFAVIFFLSVGMLFNPRTIYDHFLLFSGILTTILVVKPIAAYLILRQFHFPAKSAAIVGVALAQIGEFSFIFAEEALRYSLIPETGYDVLVACALISISINPLLFKALSVLTGKHFKNWSDVSADSEAGKIAPEVFQKIFESNIPEPPKIIVIGFGPVGQAAVTLIEQNGICPVIVEQNIDTVPKIKEANRIVFYGDATSSSILETAYLEDAKLLIITIPDTEVAIAIIKSARGINSSIPILARVQYISDEALLKDLNVECICLERESVSLFASAISPLIARVQIA